MFTPQCVLGGFQKLTLYFFSPRVQLQRVTWTPRLAIPILDQIILTTRNTCTRGHTNFERGLEGTDVKRRITVQVTIEVHVSRTWVPGVDLTPLSGLCGRARLAILPAFLDRDKQMTWNTCSHHMAFLWTVGTDYQGFVPTSCCVTRRVRWLAQTLPNSVI